MNQILPDGNSSRLQYLPNSREYNIPRHAQLISLGIFHFRVTGGLQSTTDYLWKVDFSGTGGNPKFDLDFSPTFYFALVEAGDPVISTLSQEVNFTYNGLSSSSSTQTILSSSTSSLGSNTAPTLSTAPLATITSTVSLPTATSPSTSSESNTGLSSSAKIGVGVGVGVGVIALIAGFGSGYWFFGRKRAAPQHTYPEQTYHDSPPAMNQNAQFKPELVSPGPKQFERSELQ
ncbi:hypothetical protein ONS95_001884 [Cadophora gregata]|uniref:uncharacterized protein n=1 Tax=Cadophora gregata TaxID=51156 RepID=UPI0026DD33C1|nr:uncharacterized protein ONS95_001884 [Cadophora gregata]KAK0111530.1 hypothetical protein ONS95_001884 [Cadophora gregata]KAK0111994.1 hypothetical protein ONS96_001256 [Cadophora gregata f. sp. sojae]